MTPEAAYAECERITRREARNFAFGIRLLDHPRRAALSAVYAMARRIDDIGDGDGTAEAKRAALGSLRLRLANPAAGESDDPVMVALADAAAHFPIPMEAFGDLITGCEHDNESTTYETFEDLVHYCRLVAGSIGRLSLGVFGSSAPERAPLLADQLGVALQLTNILRDLVEDRDQMGRIYLPRTEMAAVGVEPDLSGPRDAVATLVLLIAARARSFYAEGMELLELLDHRSRACTGAMAGIYLRLLERIEADPHSVLRGRVSVPPSEKAWVALRNLAGLGV